MKVFSFNQSKFRLIGLFYCTADEMQQLNEVGVKDGDPPHVKALIVEDYSRMDSLSAQTKVVSAAAHYRSSALSGPKDCQLLIPASQANHSRDKSGCQNEQKKKSKLDKKSEVLSTGSAPYITGSNMGSSIPTKVVKRQNLQKKRDSERDDQDDPLQTRNRSAAVSKVESSENPNTTSSALSVGDDNSKRNLLKRGSIQSFPCQQGLKSQGIERGSVYNSRNAPISDHMSTSLHEQSNNDARKQESASLQRKKKQLSSNKDKIKKNILNGSLKPSKTARSKKSHRSAQENNELGQDSNEEARNELLDQNLPLELPEQSLRASQLDNEDLNPKDLGISVFKLRQYEQQADQDVTEIANQIPSDLKPYREGGEDARSLVESRPNPIAAKKEYPKDTDRIIDSVTVSVKRTSLIYADSSKPTSAPDSSEVEVQVIIMPPPNPLLPKSMKVQDKPPESSIKNIVFKKLKEFKQFQNQQQDQLASSIKPIKQDKAKIDKEKSGAFLLGPVQISIEQSRLIRNIVYMRDITILDTLGKTIHELTQKDIFQHENLLDVKQLIREREIAERMAEQLTDAISRAKQRAQLVKINPTAAFGALVERGTIDTKTGNFKLEGPDDKTLLFESRFESGNLYLATKVSEQEYDLLMQNDTNTKGHTQWFYFKVQNTRAGVPVKFNILNYSKPDSMFNYGMKVSVYSERKADEKEIGWHRDCTDISYFKNQIRKDFEFTKFYYTLTFTYSFEHDNDTVFFAYCAPYSYTDLQNDILKLERDQKRQKLLQIATLCKTLGGVDCQVMTITEPSPAQSDTTTMIQKKPEEQQKPGVVITARVHPGESVSSWMMRGVLYFLTDPDNKEAKLLRKNFIFKIVPMLNPDGVINGNYRCSLAGCDLNRRWKFPSRQLQPEVYYTKRLVKRVHTERNLQMYSDLHGHSRKPNVFMYGCDIKGQPVETRLFPYILSKISPLFDFNASRFGIQKSKEATARISVFKEIKTCPLIYTVESTFSGLDMGKYNGLHITTEMLESMGRDLCRALLVYNTLEVPSELINMPTIKQRPGKTSKTFAEPSSDGELVRNQHALLIKQTLIAELENNQELLKAGNGDSSCGSDSEPSEDNLEATELVKNLPAVDKPLSIALKLEQAARKEQARMRKFENSSSPIKADSKERWRWTNGSHAKNQNEELGKEQLSPQRKGKTPAMRLTEIKEVQDDLSNASPLKVGRDVNSKQLINKNKPKPKMVDAVTQTERSDYFVLKARALKHGVRQIDNKPHQRDGIIQLRIANIELHETAFGTGPRQHQSMHNHIATTTTTTLNIQQHVPLASELNTIYSPQTLQLQTTTINNNLDATRYKSSLKNTSLAAQISNDRDHGRFQRHQLQGQPKMGPTKAVPFTSTKQYFMNYMHQQQVNQPSFHSKNTGVSKTSANIEANEAKISKAVTQNVTERSQNNAQARYGSVQQPRLKQLEDFQVQSRAAQHQQKIQKSLANGQKIEASRYILSRADSESPGFPRNSTSHETTLETKDVMSRLENGGHKQVIIATNDYEATNGLKKTKRFQVASRGSTRQRSARQHSSQTQDSIQDNNNARGQQAGEMLVIEAQKQKNPRTKHNLTDFAPDNLKIVNELKSQGPQHFVLGSDGKKNEQSPLAAFLESQIQFEKNKLIQNDKRSYIQPQSGLPFSRTIGGFQMQPIVQVDEAPPTAYQIHKRPGPQMIQLQQVIQTNQGSYKDALPQLKNDSVSSPTKIQQFLINPSISNSQVNNNLTRIQSKSVQNRPLLNTTTLEAFTNPAEVYQGTGSLANVIDLSNSGTSTTLKRMNTLIGSGQQPKAIPAGARNIIQQQNKSNIYSQIYDQKNSSHAYKKALSPEIITMSGDHSKKKNNLQQPSAKQSIQFSDHSNNLVVHNSQVKFFMGSGQDSSYFNSEVSPKARPAAENFSAPQHMRDRQNISDLQIYKNRSPVILQNADQLPALQKFGSQNEILSATMTSGSGGNLRATTQVNNRAKIAANSAFNSNPAIVGEGGNNVTTNRKNMLTGAGKGNNQADTVILTNGFEQNLPFENDRIKKSLNFIYQQEPLPSGQHHEMRHNSETSLSKPQKEQSTQQTSSWTGEARNIKKISDRNSKSSTAYPAEISNVGHPAIKGDSDYMQIIRQHNQAFVPTISKVMSRKKVSDQGMAMNTSQPRHNQHAAVLQQRIQASSTGQNTKNQGKIHQSPSINRPLKDSKFYNLVNTPQQMQRVTVPLSEPRAIESEIAGGNVDLNVLQTRKLVNSSTLNSPFKKHPADLALAKRKASQKETSSFVEQHQQAVVAALPAMATSANLSTQVKKKKSSTQNASFKK